MKRILQLAVLLVLPFLLAGCLTPVANEIPLVHGDLSAKASNPNDTKLVIFNDSNFLMYGLDQTGRINVSLNGKGLTQINIGRYAQVIVPKGTCQVYLVHWDTDKFASQHEFDLTNDESFLEIHAKITSNEANLLSELPEDFEKKFKPIW